MDLPDCPPGAEGYEDSIVQVAGKKPEDTGCTKAEREFQEHLNSLKVNVEDGSTRAMVERRGRDISGKWIYLCFPCAAMCSGEAILQTHISGKKHKTKLSLKTVWPASIFEDHPFIQNEKGNNVNKGGASEKTLQKMAVEVDLHNKTTSELDKKYNKFKSVQCHLQDALDGIKVPLIGLEYLIEHPPEQSHYEPTYMCTLCIKQGHPRTIINHLTCFSHRHNYINRHYGKACNMLSAYRNRVEYREAVTVILNRLTQRIEEKFGRRRPLHIDKDDYERDKDGILQWIFKGFHFSEQNGPTFEEVVDTDLINSLYKSTDQQSHGRGDLKKDPSPPVVAAPSKSMFNSYSKPAGRNARKAPSTESLSDVSGDERPARFSPAARRGHLPQRFGRDNHVSRHAPYSERRGGEAAFRSRYAIKNNNETKLDENKKPPNHEYKVKLATDMCEQTKTAAEKTLAYHEKNPEKHPLYPEEWKKFWNRRYKEIQAEGKDPSKHDFKPEWIVFWTGRMKQLFNDELRANIHEIYRKLCLTPPDLSRRRSRSPDARRLRSPVLRYSPGRRRSPDPRRRSPDLRRRSPDLRRRSPDLRRRSPDLRRRSPEPRKRSPMPRRRSPVPRHDSPLRHLRTRSRSPVRISAHRSRSPARTHIQLESLHKRSESPLSRRDSQMRNRSPERKPSMQTVLISDDELKPGASPWNSDDDIDSLGSLPDAKSPLPRPPSRTDSAVSRHTSRGHKPSAPYSRELDLGATDNVVATLRLLVALEDYLGSLGPKIVDLLTEALKMEKETANSSEKLLDREEAVALMETAKEKLKGAVQAGLVAVAALHAVRAAIVRVAAVLHHADRRARDKPAAARKDTSSVPVAGVGSVDRAQIAKQMAAALIAQGKTDVSSEELAQLVDAVVGMAEAKKREASVQHAPSTAAGARPRPAPPSASAAAAPSASALQMLQSAYDEYDKKPEKEEAPDAMDGLSDSDLETLLKNFNELSAEEQHSLIAYLKKLEAREPRRVERLREYVTTAATSAPPAPAPADPAPAPVAAAAPAPAPAPAVPLPVKTDLPKVVTVDSDDDDDYTVEEVFKSATQKVKEDQIRQEMEIVTKSLLESKPEAVDTPASALPGLDIIKSTSAANLLALVQASIANAAPTEMMSEQSSGVVVSSNTQPRSFGDLPEASNDNTNLSINQNQQLQNTLQHLGSFSSYQGGGMLNTNQQMQNSNPNYGVNMDDRNTSMTNPNMPMNNLGNMGMGVNRNIQINDDRHMQIFDRSMGMNNRNMPMNNANNAPINSAGNMPMNNSGNNMPMNNSGNNMSMNNSGNNMPMNNSGNNIPMNNFGNNMPMNNPGNNMSMNNSGNMPMNNSGNMRSINQGMNNWDSRHQMQQGMLDQTNQNQGNQWDARHQNAQDNRGSLRTPSYDDFNNQQQQHNQGTRNNYMNNSDNMQKDRYKNQQHFGNNNYRGRGRGGQRGRGRGGFY